MDNFYFIAMGCGVVDDILIGCPGSVFEACVLPPMYEDSGDIWEAATKCRT